MVKSAIDVIGAWPVHSPSAVPTVPELSSNTMNLALVVALEIPKPLPFISFTESVNGIAFLIASDKLMHSASIELNAKVIDLDA